MVDDGTITCLEYGRYRVTTGGPSLWWFRKHARGFDVEIDETSRDYGCLAVQGPTSRKTLEALTQSSLDDLGFFRSRFATVGTHQVEITRTGYTGDLGYELWIRAEEALDVWDALVEAGQPHGLLPAGLDALDMTRVEAGFILQGVDYFSAPLCEIESRKSSPFEVGLGWSVHLKRPAFIGSEALRREKSKGSRWSFVGLEIDWDELEAEYQRHSLPPHLPSTAWRDPVPVFVRGKRQVGQATSGTWSPILKKNLALATVESEFAEIGSDVLIEQTVEYSRRKITARVVEKPFFNPERKRS